MKDKLIRKRDERRGLRSVISDHNTFNDAGENRSDGYTLCLKKHPRHF